MKKHQKVLLGIMALSLAGGIGTAIALTFKDGTGSTTIPTDDAIYLYWGTEEQNKSTNVEVANFVSGVKQYRGLVVAPQSSKGANGTVTITFKLSATDPSAAQAAGENLDVTKKYSLAGLSVKVFEVKKFDFELVSGTDDSGSSWSSYSYVGSEELVETDGATKNLVATMEWTNGDATDDTNFGVGTAQSSTSATDGVNTWNHYYTLAFEWDGTPVETDETFGGILNITQTFAEAK